MGNSYLYCGSLLGRRQYKRGNRAMKKGICKEREFPLLLAMTGLIGILLLTRKILWLTAFPYLAVAEWVYRLRRAREGILARIWERREIAQSMLDAADEEDADDDEWGD